MQLMIYRLHNSCAINQEVRSVVIQLYDATFVIKTLLSIVDRVVRHWCVIIAISVLL